MYDVSHLNDGSKCNEDHIHKYHTEPRNKWLFEKPCLLTLWWEPSICTDSASALLPLPFENIWLTTIKLQIEQHVRMCSNIAFTIIFTG